MAALRLCMGPSGNSFMVGRRYRDTFSCIRVANVLFCVAWQTN